MVFGVWYQLFFDRHCMKNYFLACELYPTIVRQRSPCRPSEAFGI